MKKWMYVAIGVVVVVGVVLAVRFLAPESPPVANDVPGPNGNVVDNGVDGDADNDVDNGVPGVETATSMWFSVEWTNDETGAITYMAKDIGTEDFKLRGDGWEEGLEMGVIINGELGQMWYLEEDDWIGIGIPVEHWGEYWGEYWEGYVTMFNDYITGLHGWTHGDWTYTDPEEGYSVRVYDIEVNPDLDDALFEP